MRTKKLLTIGILFTLILAGCNPPEGKQGTKADADGMATEEKAVVPVRVMDLEKISISRTIDYNSTLEAYEEVYMAPAQPGRIEKIYVEPGDRVNKGQKLFLMDQTQLHQTKIQVKSMEVDIKQDGSTA